MVLKNARIKFWLYSSQRLWYLHVEILQFGTELQNLHQTTHEMAQHSDVVWEEFRTQDKNADKKMGLDNIVLSKLEFGSNCD